MIVEVEILQYRNQRLTFNLQLYAQLCPSMNMANNSLTNKLNGPFLHNLSANTSAHFVLFFSLEVNAFD